MLKNIQPGDYSEQGLWLAQDLTCTLLYEYLIECHVFTYTLDLH